MSAHLGKSDVPRKHILCVFGSPFDKAERRDTLTSRRQVALNHPRSEF